jgi:hypothetical protein
VVESATRVQAKASGEILWGLATWSAGKAPHKLYPAPLTGDPGLPAFTGLARSNAVY